jgi:hypothetical protein
MDGSNFDTLVQSLSTAGSRRRALAGLLVGSLGFLSWATAEDGIAHDAIPACKKKSGRQKKRCLKKARKHNASHPNDVPPCAATCQGCCDASGVCRECCVTADCPVPACQSCQNGACVPANQGQICDTSGISGDPVRCCAGACPNPVCHPDGYTGPPCTVLEECAGVICCNQQAVICESEAGEQCFCNPVSGQGTPCGSDADCDDNATATACICGTCQDPP